MHERVVDNDSKVQKDEKTSTDMGKTEKDSVLREGKRSGFDFGHSQVKTSLRHPRRQVEKTVNRVGLEERSGVEIQTSKS